MGTENPATSQRSAGTVASPLDVAEATFQLLTCEPGGLALDCAGLHAELPARRIGLIELRDLLCSRTLGAQPLDAVWRELVTRARSDRPSWLVATVGMALPSLRTIAGTLTRGYHAGDPHDLDTELLTGFLQALREADLSQPNIRPRLCDAARRAGQRAKRIAEANVCRRLPEHTCTPPKPPWNHPDFVLSDAVAKGVVTAVDAELIGRTRLEELTLAQAAAELGLSAEAAKKRRQRAEPVLCAAIQAGTVRSQLSPTITLDAPCISGTSSSVRGRDTSDTRPDTTDPKGGWGALPGPARTPTRWPTPSPLPPIITSLYPCGRPQPAGHRTRPPSRPWRSRAVVVVVAVLLLMLALASASHAETLPSYRQPSGPKSLEQVINNLRDWLIGFLAALATLMATIGGLRYLMAGGDPSEVAKAKNTLKFAAFGYAIAALAPVLVAAVKSIVGV